ncbi:MAG: imidazoleglycerol-phosphate dehydratase HisB [Alphaproteobacteria bacterium]|jgi:imidazoleglycerol-phosphate dehydratase
MRQATVERKTRETAIKVTVGLDGTGLSSIESGVGFFNHMLDQLARHGLIDVDLKADGDLHVDDHHTVEDCGIVLGKAVAKALGERKGIRRYGEAYVPMDETLVRCVIDLSNRPFLVWRVEMPSNKIGTFDSQLVREFFQAFAVAVGATLHVEALYGENAHHVAEACFKALARALRASIEIDPRRGDETPSTKGVLGGSL